MPHRKKWIVAFIAVDEEELDNGDLPLKQELTSIPDQLAGKISDVSTALELDALFLVADKQRRRSFEFLEKHAIPYHHYAVQSRGEPCQVVGCKEHRTDGKLIRLHDRFPHVGKPARPTVH